METILDTKYNFHFDTREPITATMLAESLLGLEGVVRRSTGIIKEITGVDIPEVEILIEDVEIGSIFEDVIVRFIFGTGPEAEAKFEKIREITGVKNMTPQALVAVGIFATAAFGVYLFQKDSAAPNVQVHIQNSFNNWGGDIGMTGDDLFKAAKKGIKKREDLKEQVVKLMQPAGTSGGTIGLEGDQTYVISEELVNAVPRTYEKKAEKELQEKDFEKVTLVVRAADLDRPRSGWAGIIAEISDRRLPIELDFDVYSNNIPIGKNTLVDVTAVFEIDGVNNKIPKKYLIRKVHLPMAASQP